MVLFALPSDQRDRPPTSLFSTASVPTAERFAAWRTSIGVIFDVRPPTAGRRTFGARVAGHLLDDVMLVRCSAGAQKFDRSRHRIACDAIDHYMIQVFTAGRAEICSGPGEGPMRGVTAFDLAEVMDTYNSDFDLITAFVPRRRLDPLLRHPDALHYASLAPDEGAGRLLSGYFASLHEVAGDLSLAEAAAAARTLVDLTALAFNGLSAAQGADPDRLDRAAGLARAQAYIRSRLDAPDLRPGTVARALGMSRARLYRLFEPVGGVADYIREQRLRRCLADLVSARGADRQIAEIAYRWGFNDPLTFSRAFRQRFGRRPSDAREVVRAATREVAAIDHPVGDRLYEHWIASLA